ncbi:MAG TPA: hypothetical protein ENF30_00245 [Candidatus Desulfofervidus auxilii]|uniref:Uncharacterized protein n=1 Tax=Desulfofervidus auxilii TaxID=1621989 RepID=A0A7V0NE17_DESA2|nr:hypothetical protein [Candidatus Desulfofervidus auxilii]
MLDVYRMSFLGAYLSGFMFLGWLGFKLKEKVLWFKMGVQILFVFTALLILTLWQYTWILVFDLNLQERPKEDFMIIFIAALFAPFVFRIYDALDVN